MDIDAVARRPECRDRSPPTRGREKVAAPCGGRRRARPATRRRVRAAGPAGERGLPSASVCGTSIELQRRTAPVVPRRRPCCRTDDKQVCYREERGPGGRGQTGLTTDEL